jgi:CHAT domain-containing protein
VALSDLIWDSGRGKTLDRSISYLTMASNSNGPYQDRALSDLSAALLIRAERSQDVRDVLQAIEAADSALRIDQSSLPALFNLAVALETAGIDDQAVTAWKDYLTKDDASQWSREAHLHLSQLQLARRVVPKLPTGRSINELSAFAKSSPQPARVYGWNVLLREWGQLTLANKLDSANIVLSQIRAVSAGLREARGDQTLGAAADAIEHAADNSSRRALAQAHIDYANGQASYQTQRTKSAGLFQSALRGSSYSKVLGKWASLYYGATLVYDGDISTGLSRMTEAYSIAGAQEPALKATASWMMGTTLLRQGQYETALDRFVAASKLFDQCGERENATVLRLLAADAQFKLGDAITAYATTLDALRSLRTYERSVWTHSILAVLASAASTDGLHGAALRLQTEGLRAAESLDQPIYVAEARLARARVAISRDRDLARRDVDSAAAIISRTGDPDAQEWFRADLALTRSETANPGSKQFHIRSLDSAFATFDGRKNKIRVLETLIARADAQIEAGQFGAARSNLLRAALILRSEHDATASAVLRQSVLSLGQDVFARAAALAIAEADTVGGLMLLEASRATFSWGRRDEPSDAMSRLPDGITALNYLTMSDTLFIWVVNDGGTHLIRRRLDGFQIEDSVAQLLNSLESGADARSNAILIALSNQLISPITEFINNGDRLLVAGGGWVSAMPFAAMRDQVRNRYLIEDHPIAFASSMRFRINPRSRGSVNSAVVVSEPVLPESRNFAVIRGAASEGAEVAAFYSGASVLTKKNATPSAALAAASKSSVFHFAGHAVADPLRPMDSYLALSAELPNDSTGKLTAEMIQRTRLNNVQLVVLSACETVRPSHFEHGETGALLLAFLAAGAKEVVGSTWRVDDRATHTLLTEFHRTYARKRDAVAALRHSQLKMIHSTQAWISAPSAWAGFHVQVH